MKKSKAGTIFAICIGVFMFAYLLITGIADLVNTKDLYDVNINGCFEVLTVEHSINGIIPTGKDHYYIGFNGAGSPNAYLIKAPASWYKKNFYAEDGDCITPPGPRFTALAKRVDSYEVREALNEKFAEVDPDRFVVGPEYCLVTNYKILAFAKIFLIVGLVLMIVVAKFMSDKQKDFKGIWGKILLVLFIIWCFAFLKVII